MLRYRQMKWLGSMAKRLGLLVLVLLCGASTNPPPIRLALVIGNGDYANSDQLPNAPRDATRLSETLIRLGFQVEVDNLNLDKAALNNKVKAFGKKLIEARPNVIGFFYYAGHAAQDADGVNYMIPIDAKARTPDEVREEGIRMQDVLKAMHDSNNSINIVVLDACRDWFKDDRTPHDRKGLGDMGNHASVVIAYAVRPGDTADEGADLDSSPFSRRLIEAFDNQADEAIVLVLDDVKSLVYQDSDSSQLPLIVNGLTASGRWALTSQTLAGIADKPQPIGAGTPTSVFLNSLDRKRLLTYFRGRESLVDALLARRDVLEKHGINTPSRLAHFLAQIGFESGGFSVKEEKFGYSAAALRSNFARYVTSDEMAQRIAGHPQLVANTIYARRELGNGPPESGDGWRYRGRGPFGFFMVGRYNYSRYGKMLGIDLLEAPDLASDPEIGVALSAAIWSSAKANIPADADDLKEVTRRLMGGSSNLDARKVWLAQAKRAVAPRP